MALLRKSCARLTPYVSSILDFLLPPPPPPPSASLCLVGPGLEGVPAWALHAAALEQQRAGQGEGEEEGGDGEGGLAGGGSGAAESLLGRLLRRMGPQGSLQRSGGGGLIEALTNHLWMAVPKRKTSYSTKRQRQMNPLYARKNLLNFYPCPKCDKDFLKLRHHLCPCDQEKANISGVKKARWAAANHTHAHPAACTFHVTPQRPHSLSPLLLLLFPCALPPPFLLQVVYDQGAGEGGERMG